MSFIYTFFTKIDERLQFLHTVKCLSHKNLILSCVFTLLLYYYNIKINFLHTVVQDLVLIEAVCMCILQYIYIHSFIKKITKSIYKLKLCAISAAGMQIEAPGETSLEDDKGEIN